MKSVTVINRLSIKPGKMDEFIDTQRKFASALPPCGLLGGRMYRSVDGQTADLQPLVDASSPMLYEEAYTTGDF